MTPEELKKLIEHGPTEDMVAALASLAEAERKKLAKGVVAIRKELSRRETERNRRQHAPPPPCPHCGKPLRTATARQCFECGKNWYEGNVEGRVSLDHWNPTSEVRLKLALMAVAPWTETQRIRVWHVEPRHFKGQQHRDHLFQILSDRRPDWLSKWVDKEMEDDNFGDWEFVRRLVRAQLCPKPQSENYILRMLRGVFSYDTKMSLKARLESDPELLLDEVWRIFEISPIRATILHSTDITYVPQADTPSFSWSATLLSLSRQGRLDRQRLLTASLGSLLKNTEARNTTWFSKFHELLEPTAEERAALQTSYLQLLSHPVPAVVGMALDALGILEKAQKLDDRGFLGAVVAVFHVQPKAQPMAAAKLLGRLAARQSGQAARIAETALAGLTHPVAQVQQALVDVLAKLESDAAEVIAAQLPGLLDALVPSVQEPARKLIVATPAGQAFQPDTPDSQPGNPDLFAEARQIPSPWREQAGIDVLLQAFEGNGELSAVAFNAMGVPRLDPAQRIEPIQTLDELIERLTVAVETLDDAIEFELLVDGLSRVCDQRPDDFQTRLAPLLHRCEAVIPRGATVSMSLLGLRAPLIKLVRRWYEVDGGDTHEERDSILGFLDVRLKILAVRFRKKLAAPLLACPTHRQGWIDPRDMLQRLTWYEQHAEEPNRHDFIQGILRLAPDRRAETLAASNDLRGPFGAVFRYALGGPLEDSSLPAALLVAAGRARTPFADLALPELTLAGPDAVAAAQYFLDANPTNTEKPAFCPSCGKAVRTPYARQCFACGADWHDQQRAADADLPYWLPASAMIRVGVRPNVPAPEQTRDLPTVLLHSWLLEESLAWSGGGAKGVLHWLSTVWPANPAPFFVIGIRLRRAPYMVASIYRLRAAFLEPLFDADVPFTEMAQLLVALALGQAEPEVTGLAVDVLIELIRDGRCIGDELGRAMRPLLASDLVKLNRLGKQLETAARASHLHAHVCAHIVQSACSELIEVPKDLHHLLGPLLEWLSALKQGVRAEFRPLLEKATMGKTGTLAKRLLERAGTQGVDQRVLSETLDGRLQRAKRWLSRAAGR